MAIVELEEFPVNENTSFIRVFATVQQRSAMELMSDMASEITKQRGH